MSGSVAIHPGDNRLTLRRMIDEGVRVHSVVTDPPYGLTSITKRFGKDDATPAKHGTDGAFKRASGGFMGKTWDGTGIERDPEFWRLIWEILLPGGCVFAFSGSRTGHWQACAMETAGFIMHPMHGWVFSTGFPKAHSASKQIDKMGGVNISWFGPWLKQWREANGITQKQVAALFPSRTGGLTGCVENWELGLGIPTTKQFNLIRDTYELPFGSIKDVEREVIGQRTTGIGTGNGSTPIIGDSANRDITAPATPEAAQWDGWAYGTQTQKPALENIYLGQKPHDIIDVFALLVHDGLVAMLEAELCQSRERATELLSSASAAEVIITLSHRGLIEQSIAQSLVRLLPVLESADPTGEAEDMSALTDTLLCELMANTSSNTVKSWRTALAVLWSLGSTHTTVISSETITDLKTWNSLTGLSTPGSTIQLSELTGDGSNAAIAGRCLKRACARLLSQLGTIATEIAFERLARPETDPAANRRATLQPIYLGQKPFSEKTGAANLLKHGVGAFNVDGCRVPQSAQDVAVQRARTGGTMSADPGNAIYSNGWKRQPAGNQLGRWPANLLHDNSPEVVALFPDSKAGTQTAPRGTGGIWSGTSNTPAGPQYGDSGSAARFFNSFEPDADPVFYNPKAGRVDRASHLLPIDPETGKRKGGHPTVKPIALMRHLIRHITPPGGTCLDPFAGSGTTGEAARMEGFDCILMEAEPEYVEFLHRRFAKPIAPVQVVVKRPAEVKDSRQPDLFTTFLGAAK